MSEPNATSYEPLRTCRPVLGVPIDAITPAGAVQQLLRWAKHRESRVVCICNAHSVVSATQQSAVRAAIETADMATPDGAPVAWMLRRLGIADQQRVSGPDLMVDYFAAAALAGESIFLFGSTEQTLTLLRKELCWRWPTLHIAGNLSPPFRPLHADEDAEVVRVINLSGASTVWVSLGCPKQELWMAEHRGHIQAVMIGVGAAFDFHAGTVARAPKWMRDRGLEWLHRLASEPARLWKRYLVTNTLFILGAARQLLIPR